MALSSTTYGIMGPLSETFMFFGLACSFFGVLFIFRPLLSARALEFCSTAAPALTALQEMSAWLPAEEFSLKFWRPVNFSEALLRALEDPNVVRRKLNTRSGDACEMALRERHVANVSQIDDAIESHEKQLFSLDWVFRKTAVRGHTRRDRHIINEHWRLAFSCDYSFVFQELMDLDCIYVSFNAVKQGQLTR
ncbi:hypothetical protein Nepgr_000548 [Nepenthes gracilis]|uniref:Uncharacterized protein n=1 Tax=Nepenthes gracilis TaxID=150966 RepID=A0AAD3P344_NEPGR|nr:hypothetical protein Nepgr_000548 [Nepenthes gracilis]